MTTTTFAVPAPVETPTAAGVRDHLQRLIALRDGLIARAGEVQADILRAEGKLDLLLWQEGQAAEAAGATMPLERTTLPQEPRTASAPYFGRGAASEGS